MSPGLVTLFLALLLGIQPITTDLYLPALTEGFGASMPQAQLTLTGLLLAFGVSQLVWGQALQPAGVHSAWSIALPFYLFMLGHGVHQPCSQSGAVGPFPQAAGAASALNGFVMMLAAFAMGGWLGTHMDGTLFPLAYGLWFWSVLIAASAWTLVQKYGEPARH